MPRVATSQTIPDTSSLAPFVRRGLEGWCVLCLEPVHAHFGHKGTWIGCQAASAPMRAFLLVPDRRNRRADSTRPSIRSASPDMHLSAPQPDDTSHELQRPAARKAASKPATVPARATERRTAATATPAPARALRAPMGPQVMYTARYKVTDSPISRLPPHDRKVYGLIARTRTKGATRAHLLDALDARQAPPVLPALSLRTPCPSEVNARQAPAPVQFCAVLARHTVSY